MKTIRTSLIALGLAALTFGTLPTAQAVKMCPYTAAITIAALIDQTFCIRLPDGSARTLCRIGALGSGGAVLIGGTYKAFKTYGPSAITHPVTEQTLDDDDNEAEVDVDTEDL